MKHSRLLLLPVLLAPVLLSSVPHVASETSETRIALEVSDGAVVKRTFTAVAEVMLDSMDMTMNGQPPPVVPNIEMTVTTEVTTVVEDKVVSARDGRILRLERLFTELGQQVDMVMEMDMMGQVQSEDMNTAATSKLEGETVVFVLDEDSGEYRVRWPEGREGRSELLANLTQDMDMVAFLPEGAVEEGQSWSVDPASLGPILAPGGDLKLVPDDVDPSQLGMISPQGSAYDWFGEGLSGTVTATFEGVRSEGGAQLAAIRIQFDITNAVDMTELMQQAMEKMELPPEAGDFEFDHMDMEIQYDGEGLLLWNLDLGRAQSYDSSGDFGMLLDMGMKINVQGQEMDIQQTMEMSGSLTHTARFE